LIAAGTLIEEPRPADAPFRPPVPGPPNPHLTPAQGAAADVLRAAVRAGAGPPILLDGVTGSGKTETYFEAVAEAIEAGRQVLVLLPEIALTAQTLDRFTERFGERPAEWHSGLSQPERRRVWRGVAEGQAHVVVGARSALFLPFAALGLIIVDEEHDQSYKQEDGVVYHARDMAVVRARLEGCPVVLASATPSLETMINAEQGRYRHVVLPTRYGPARMPEVQPSDLRQAGMDASHWIGPGVSAGIGQALDRGEQALLFLNRRGYSPLVLCRACGHRLMSPNASSWLVEHRYTGRLVCHLTGYSRPKPTRCTECGTEGSLVSCGPGVERIAEEAAALFPQARLAVMSSDMLHTRTDAADLVTRMAAGEIDILVATQMAAKGHNFPGLTFVGIIDADMSLRGGDLRAGERTFQLLHQVAGRAGRADRPGSVLLQTYAPDHPVIAALCSGDRAGFYDREAFEREAMGMPPFGRLAAVILSGRDGAATQDFARGLRALAPVADGLSIYGPAPAAHAIVRGQHRYRLLLKAAPEKSVQTYLRQWLGPVRVPSGLRLSIDVDPYSFL
ncbi:MAG: primosomal protein N', partial [Pseudomonadota bacterium]